MKSKSVREGVKTTNGRQAVQKALIMPLAFSIDYMLT